MLTHVDQNNLPTMVDVTDKQITARTAKARTLVQLPIEFKTFVNEKEITLKKGPVFQTAIIAGTMAVKKTHELIPFCHQIPVEGCRFDVIMNEDLLITIICEVKTTGKTGVEMEAIHGAMTAGLTIYDMCKALSHNILIKETKLLSKTGGKRTVLDRPTYGLVLTGGKSERMKRDKALIAYHGEPHARYIHDVLKNFCEEVYLSAQPHQWNNTDLEDLPTIHDAVKAKGPIAGILSAFAKHADANWLVVACDLPHFNSQIVETLLSKYESDTTAIAFKNAAKGFPEPLCALYTPKAKQVFETAILHDITCPVKVLRNTEVKLLDQVSGINLANINTTEEFAELTHDQH